MNTIGFNNFKAFGEKMQSFSKKPITLVYGANSVGKSALLHRELYLQYVLDTKELDVSKTTMFGDEVDFGGFDRFVHRRNPKNEICLHLSTDGFKNQYDDQEWKLFYSYTPEMQRSLLEKIDALSEDECKRKILNLPSSKSINIQDNYLDLKSVKGKQFESYSDIGTKIFDPESVWGVEIHSFALRMKSVGRKHDSKLTEDTLLGYVSLQVPVFNPYFIEEASLLLGKEIMLEDCKSYEFNKKLYKQLKETSLTIIVKNDKNKQRVHLAQKFLNKGIKPEWMCFTKTPLIPMLEEGYSKDHIESAISRILVDKNDELKKAPKHLRNEAYRKLAETIYGVLFSNGYHDELCDVIYCCVEETNGKQSAIRSAKGAFWNAMDYKARETLFNDKITTSYKEYLLSYTKKMFQDIEEKRYVALNIYIGKIDQDNEVGIARIEINRNHQQYLSANYLAGGEVECEFDQSYPDVQEICSELDASPDDGFLQEVSDILNHKTKRKVNSKFWINSFEDKEVFNYFTFDVLTIIDHLLLEFQKETLYIGPLRDYPSREDAFIVNDDTGKNNILLQLRNSAQLREIVNHWFASSNKLRLPYRVKMRKLIDIDDLYESEEHFLKISQAKDKKEIVQYLQENLEGLSEITFVDTRTNTPVHNRDMGLGVTQILPIIMATNTKKNAQIIIEQPELHLHPALQCELADEFIRSYKEYGNSFLIESHSEHLLLRIMKRMRHTAGDKQDRDKSLDLTPDDVCLLYVDSDGENTFINELELDEDGTLLDIWPKGFFEEDYNERFD